MPDHLALLPCPCCGGIQADRRTRVAREPILEEVPPFDHTGWRVSCPVCGINTGAKNTEADAVLTWHRRAA